MWITDGGTDDTVTFTPGPTSRYQWVAAGAHPCPRCAELDGEIRTLDQWESSVTPGLHKHCHCYLRCIEAIDSGMAFANQFTHVGNYFNIDGSISHQAHWPGPQHLSKRNREEAEGAEDLQPYTPPRNTSTDEYDNSDGGDQYSNRGV